MLREVLFLAWNARKKSHSASLPMGGERLCQRSVVEQLLN